MSQKINNIKQGKRVETSKLMSQYEQDLTWMAYRYAIGRHTISCHSIAGDMAKHIPNRVTQERQFFMARDIQHEIAMQLRYQPFFFQMQFDDDMAKDWVPLDRFFDFCVMTGIKDVKELEKYSSIAYLGVRNGEPYFETDPWEEGADASKGKREIYSGMDWEDLMIWSNLAKLLDVSKHDYCLCKKDGDYHVIEYFSTYQRVNRPNSPSLYEKIKMPCKQFANNSSVITRIDEQYIIEDGLCKEMAQYYADKYVIEIE